MGIVLCEKEVDDAKSIGLDVVIDGCLVIVYEGGIQLLLIGLLVERFRRHRGRGILLVPSKHRPERRCRLTLSIIESHIEFGAID